MGYKPRVEVMPTESRFALNGKIARDGYKYVVTILRASGSKIAKYHYDFGSHPLRELVSCFVYEVAEESAGGTLNQRCRVLKVLEQFMAVTGERDLNPESFIVYVRWLYDVKKPNGNNRFSESSKSSYISTVTYLYRRGLEIGRTGWTQRDLDAMTTAANRLSKGSQQRAAQQSVEKALSRDTFNDLLKAVSLELEQCREVLRARDAGERQSLYNLGARHMSFLDPNPFVAFALQAAMRHGIRAGEFNSMKPADLRVDEQNRKHTLYVHAPNKRDDMVPVDDLFVESWMFCHAWSAEACDLVGDDLGNLFRGKMFVYLPTHNVHADPLMRTTTYLLNSSHMPYFFRKWFAHKIKDEHGCERPLLHADGDECRPLHVDYAKIRNAFAVRFAEHEKNRVLTSHVLRHSSVRTTERYYLHQTKLDHAKRVHLALTTEAQKLVMHLRNAILAGISEETLRRAEETGAVTPHGVCGSALNGGGCERSGNCLECAHLVIVQSRRPRFIADRDAYLKRAENLESEGDLRGAENALSSAALCEAQLVRIDKRYGGR